MSIKIGGMIKMTKDWISIAGNFRAMLEDYGETKEDLDWIEKQCEVEK